MTNSEGYDSQQSLPYFLLEAQSISKEDRSHQMPPFGHCHPKQAQSDGATAKQPSTYQTSIQHNKTIFSASEPFKICHSSKMTSSQDDHGDIAILFPLRDSPMIHGSPVESLREKIHISSSTISGVRNMRHNDRTISVSAQKRERLKTNYGPSKVANENRIKGDVSFQGDQMLWYDPKQSIWRPAAYHSDYRQELIQLDSVNKDYLVEPARGQDTYDVTSACNFLHQHEWQFDTSEQLALIRDEEGNAIFQLDKRPERLNCTSEAKEMTYNGLILLDQDDLPVYDFDCIPRCFSSSLEGGRFEAIRRVFPFLHSADFRARMPRLITVNRKIKHIYGLSTLRHRASRFRDKHRIPAFDLRDGSAEKNLRWIQERVQFDKQAANMGSSPHSRPDTSGLPPQIHPHLSEDVCGTLSAPSSTGYQSAPDFQGFIPFQLHNHKAGEHDNTELGDLALSGVKYLNVHRKPGFQALLQEHPAIITQHPNMISTALSGVATAPATETITSGHSLDYRNIAPQTPLEQLQVEVALMSTKNVYRRINGCEPPPTPTDASYSRQLTIIMLHHLENYPSGRDCPELPQLGPWYGGFGFIPTSTMLPEAVDGALEDSAQNETILE